MPTDASQPLAQTLTSPGEVSIVMIISIVVLGVILICALAFTIAFRCWHAKRTPTERHQTPAVLQHPPLPGPPPQRPITSLPVNPAAKETATHNEIDALEQPTQRGGIGLEQPSASGNLPTVPPSEMSLAEGVSLAVQPDTLDTSTEPSSNSTTLTGGVSIRSPSPEGQHSKVTERVARAKRANTNKNSSFRLNSTGSPLRGVADVPSTCTGPSLSKLPHNPATNEERTGLDAAESADVTSSSDQPEVESSVHVHQDFV
eukprot:CAMPEP_0181177330 /NCGR_PEP_ID=MMETSP1096-20121128/5103_1 /TAXON_ID=156174 ORGANISM="Chrysochromulina ericina, Strain CCMP281" /NCGR_SAMPLE_ID=MMETSP1096 /ASSEMBLY_ACC=CAM_ASM_000453 /LENGTH=258 /DNA_ID=CAMNT_0023265473 /DNA_START=1 /DNA_END=777 /DNA_ORIENTATION=+